MSTYDSKIVALREQIGLNQEQFAIVLGVKKLTINRYEREYDPNPIEIVKQKLFLLRNTMNDDNAKEFVKDIFKSNQTSAAAAILSSMLQLGASIFSQQMIDIHKYTILDIVNNPVGINLMKHIKNEFDKNKIVITV